MLTWRLGVELSREMPKPSGLLLHIRENKIEKKRAYWNYLLLMLVDLWGLGLVCLFLERQKSHNKHTKHHCFGSDRSPIVTILSWWPVEEEETCASQAVHMLLQHVKDSHPLSYGC